MGTTEGENQAATRPSVLDVVPPIGVGAADGNVQIRVCALRCEGADGIQFQADPAVLVGTAARPVDIAHPDLNPPEAVSEAAQGVP